MTYMAELAVFVGGLLGLLMGVAVAMVVDPVSWWPAVLIGTAVGALAGWGVGKATEL